MTKVNLGVFTEIATEKADRDLRNVDLTKTDVVIEYQEPTTENNYTWYRLYASGWVEQGGYCSGKEEIYTVDLPITMADGNYSAVGTYVNPNGTANTTLYTVRFFTRNTSNFTCDIIYYNGSGRNRTNEQFDWVISGKADMTGHEVLPSKKAIDEYDHRVVAFQKPTAANNYTWYRKYADGWIEMGGSAGTITTVDSNNNYITLPVTMLDTNYTATMTLYNTNNMNTFNTGDVCPDFICGKTTTKIQIHSDLWTGQMNWRVEGLYATE